MIEGARVPSRPRVPHRRHVRALLYDDASLAARRVHAIVHLRSDEPSRVPTSTASRAGRRVAVAFHIGADTVHVDELFGAATSLDFVLHRPDAVIGALGDAGFALEARLDREPYLDAEYPSRRCYLLARKA
jgi:hypothetical protein